MVLTNKNGAAIIEMICYLIVLLIIAVINATHRKSIKARLDTKGWVAFIMYPAITLVVISLLLYVPQEEISEKVFRIIIVFAVSMLFLSIIQFYLLENIMIRESEIYNKQALIEQAEHVNQMYRSLSEEREIQKARAHDYLNHLNVLLALAEHNNSVEEIKYIKEQIGASSEIVDIIDTGNAVINAVLNYKYREAKKKSIIMPLIIDDLSNLKISESDIVTILSNILDNAIEATEKCDNKKIVLQISKQDQKHLLYIDSSNTCLPDLFIEEKHHTTKENKENHGYGISNIKYTVEKNNGECIIDQKDGIFRIIITIPL
jgi:sensor histidine kinase YesM